MCVTCSAGLAVCSLDIGEMYQPAIIVLSWHPLRIDLDILIRQIMMYPGLDSTRRQQLELKGSFYREVVGACHIVQDELAPRYAKSGLGARNSSPELQYSPLPSPASPPSSSSSPTAALAAERPTPVFIDPIARRRSRDGKFVKRSDEDRAQKEKYLESLKHLSLGEEA